MEVDWIPAGPDAPIPLLGVMLQTAARSQQFSVPSHTLAVLGVVIEGSLRIQGADGRTRPLPQLFAEGCRTRPASYRVAAGTRWISVLGRADLWTLLSNQPAKAMVDRTLTASPAQLGDWLTPILRLRVAGPSVDSRAIAHSMLEIVTDALRKAPPRAATRRLNLAMGELQDHDLPALSARLGLSERSLQRVFASELGVSAKVVQRLARLHRALARWDGGTDPHTTLADLAVASGYADQAHLAREFRALVGAPPRSLKAGGQGAGSVDDVLWALREGARHLVPGLFQADRRTPALSEIDKPREPTPG